MKVKVDTQHPNPALISLIHNYTQIIPVDANFFLVPDRSKLNPQLPTLDFSFFQKCWLDPVRLTFPNLAIHKAVELEIVSGSSFNYLNEQKKYQYPLRLSDSEFSQEEEYTRRSIEKKIAKYTMYEPEKDNADDRGEVKSLAYIATKGLLYFCSHDSKALQLVEKAEEWETNLENVSAVRFYEIIYYLLRMKMGPSKYLKAFYRLLYLMTTQEKRENPTWDDFQKGMDNLYLHEIQQSKDKPKPIYK
jgi:hypothetical protein